MSRKRLVPYIENGRLNIIDAVPGAGKTTMLVHNLGLAHRQWGIPQNQILALTFNRAMAEELQARCAEQGLNVGATTLHAFGFALINEDPRRFGLTNDIRVLNHEHRYLGAEYTKVFGKKGPISLRLLKSAVDTRFNHGTRVRRFLRAEGIKDPEIDKVLEFLDQYSRTKKNENQLGFHDMISLPLSAMKKDPEYLRQVCDQYQLLAVDEYQDLNAQERELTLLLAQHIPTVLVVGDDLQAVHLYRGAKIGAVEELSNLFEGTNIIELNHSYRVTKPQAEFLNLVLTTRSHKPIESTRDGPLPHIISCNSRDHMYRRALTTIVGLRKDGVQDEDIAVIARFGTSIQTFARYLERRAIPFSVTKARDRRYKELRKFGSFLRAVLDDKHLAKSIRKRAGVDRKTATLLSDLTIEKIQKKQLGLTKEQGDKCKATRDAIKQVREVPQIHRALAVFAASQGYKDRTSLIPIQHVLRAESIKFDHTTTIEELLQRVDQWLRLHKRETSGSTTGITLSTTHGAKGRQWQHVLVLDGYDENLGKNGEIPVDEDAEFNVFYVAMTRAKVQSHLFLLKHEAAIGSIEYKGDKTRPIVDEELVEKWAYTDLRFLPPYSEVKGLCGYDRCKPTQ